MKYQVSRREFMATTVSAAALAAGVSHAATAPKRPVVCIFSKHLQFLDYAGLAEMGIEFFFDVLREAGIRGAVAVDSTGVFGNGVAHLDVTLAGISVECAVR